jgi:hypothetical protein
VGLCLPTLCALVVVAENEAALILEVELWGKRKPADAAMDSTHLRRARERCATALFSLCNFGFLNFYGKSCN